MSNKAYFLLSIFFLSLSFGILAFKGYFNIRSFQVSGSEEIQVFLNNTHTNKSYFLTTQSNISTYLKNEFSKIESVKVKKLPNLQFKVEVTKKTPFAVIDNNLYISDKGDVFYDESPVFIPDIKAFITNATPNQKVLSQNQVNFITNVNVNNYSIEIIKPYHFYISSSNAVIEVDRDYEDLVSMYPFVNEKIASKNTGSKISVYGNKIVLEN